MSQRLFPRPTSVAVVCYFLLILGGVAGVIRAILTYARQGTSPLEPPVPIGEILSGLMASILIGFCAVFMLRGANWARILFFVGAGFIAIGVVAAGFTGSGVRLIIYLVIAGAILATPAANRFFLGKERPPGESAVPREYSLPPEPQSRHSRNRYDY